MGNNYDVLVVGAGPIGCKVAELLSKDYDVLVIDKKSEIGKPVQCSGFNSERIFELSGVSRKVVINKVTKSKFFSPSGKNILFHSKRPFYVFDRELFDKELAKKAEKAGSEILLKTEFKGYKREQNYLKIYSDDSEFKTKILIGADGPNSSVARFSGLSEPKNVVVGLQETIKYSFDPDIAELWFGSKVSPDFFAWVIPENESYARVGVGSSYNPKYYFQKFIKSRIKKPEKSKNKVVGIIRFGLIENSVSERVLLVGDAACQIKPFSGGGLIYGLIGAKIASEACKACLDSGNFDSQFLKKNYDDKWKEKLAGPIKRGLWLSNVIHSTPDWLLDFGFRIGKYMSPVLDNFLDEDML